MTQIGENEYPQLLHTVVDTTDVRGLAEFYREFLGLQYRSGHEPPSEGVDEPDWLSLVDANRVRKIAFQKVDRLKRTTWPSDEVPMQMHLDFTVSSVEELRRHRERAEALGAEVRPDQADDPDEALLCPRGPVRASVLHLRRRLYAGLPPA